MDQAPAIASTAELTVGQYIDQLSSSAPVPGGGSASAVAAAVGASLVAMVAGLSTGRPKYAAYESTHNRCSRAGRDLAAQFLTLADRDAREYGNFAQAMKMPRDTDEQKEARKAAIRTAARAASKAPLECVRACEELVNAADSLAGRSNVNAASDVLVAALLGEAAARGAAENVLINLPATEDEQFARTMRQEVDATLHRIATMAAQVREIVMSGQQRDPELE